MSICQFISDACYDGRLTAYKSTAECSLNLQNVDLPNEGIAMITVEHEGCSQKSIEEGEIIKAKHDALLGQEFADRDGTIRPITEDDILVVANPKLLGIPCGTVERMKLVSTFCWLDEYTGGNH